MANRQRGKMPRGAKIQSISGEKKDGAHIDTWQTLHNQGVFNPNYSPNHADLLWARKKLHEGVGNKPHKILDVGAGKGTITRELNNPLIQVVSLEPTRMKQATHKVSQAMVRGVAEKIPFKAGTFDTVLMSYALSYANREKAVAEIRRVLRKGGRAVLLLHKPNSVYMKSLMHGVRGNSGMIELFQKIDAGKYKKFGNLLKDARTNGADSNPEWAGIKELLRYFLDLKKQGKNITPFVNENIKRLRVKTRPFKEMAVDHKTCFPQKKRFKTIFQEKD